MKNNIPSSDGVKYSSSKKNAHILKCYAHTEELYIML